MGKEWNWFEYGMRSSSDRQSISGAGSMAIISCPSSLSSSLSEEGRGQCWWAMRREACVR